MFEDPYRICMIEGCFEYAEHHHDPPRSTLAVEDYDNPLFRQDLCRKHHTEFHSTAGFKERHPEYKPMTRAEYRRWKKR